LQRGIRLIGDYRSMTPYSGDPLVMLTIMGLVIAAA
jgi:hypothetical protein